MSYAFGLLTSESSLLPCELRRLSHEVRFELPRGAVAGAGVIGAEGALLRRFSAATLPGDPMALWDGGEAESLLFVADRLPVPRLREENIQPFRGGGWLFSLLEPDEAEGAGPSPVPAERHDTLRRAVLAVLPEHLARGVGGDTLGEAVFGLFQARLREATHGEERRIAPVLLADVIGALSRELDALAGDRDGTGRPPVTLLAARAGLLVMAREGGAPLHYRLLEGQRECERCGVEPGTSEGDPRVARHARRRSVVLATHPRRPEEWLQVKERTLLVIDDELTPLVRPL